MKRTDDFLADLETQLGAAAAGSLRRRRRPALHVLRPMIVVAIAATAVVAFVLAATSGVEPERAADPAPPSSGGTLVTPQQAVPSGDCATLDETTDAPPPQSLVGNLAVLRRPQGEADRLRPNHTVPPVTGFDPRFVRGAVSSEVTLVASGGIVSRACSDGESRAAATEGPGVCVIVEFDQPRTACWTLAQITNHRAVAVTMDDLAIALLPDGVREVTFDTGRERDTYAVTDNVVIANVEGLRAGKQFRLATRELRATVCGDAAAEGGDLPSELKAAIPVLNDRENLETAPDEVIDLLSRAGAARVWADQAHRLHAGDETGAWLVPVADSLFSECAEGTVHAPREFEGPGACLVGFVGDDVAGAFCADLDDFGGVGAIDAPGGRRLVMGFLPHGVHIVEMGGEAVLGGVDPPRGADAGLIDRGGTLDFVYRGFPERIDPADVKSNRISVIASDLGLAERVRRRLADEGLETGQLGEHPRVEESVVYYAAGMSSSASQVAELLRVQDVLPVDLEIAAMADTKADVIVVAGDDLRP